MRAILLSAALSIVGALQLPNPPKNPSFDPATLPGDPSLILSTNVVIGDKLAFMKSTSKLIASALSKPETYVAVCVNDGLDMIWAGESTPCALGVLYSIGQINKVPGNMHHTLRLLSDRDLLEDPSALRRTMAR